MTTLFIVIGCIAGFNAIYLFFYIMDDIVSQIRKISKPKKQTADFTFLDDLDELEDEPEKPEKPETFEIYDISSLTEDDDSMPELSPNALKSLRSYDVRRFIKEEMYWLKDYILDELSRLATHYGFIDGGCMIKEISAQELESRCRKCIRASVSSTGALARVLDAMGAAYSIVDDSQADIYGEVQITALVEALGREGCTVYSVKEHDESLESFYMELVGGERHV